MSLTINRLSIYSVLMIVVNTAMIFYYFSKARKSLIESAINMAKIRSDKQLVSWFMSLRSETLGSLYASRNHHFYNENSNFLVEVIAVIISFPIVIGLVYTVSNIYSAIFEENVPFFTMLVSIGLVLLIPFVERSGLGLTEMRNYLSNFYGKRRNDDLFGKLIENIKNHSRWRVNLYEAMGLQILILGSLTSSLAVIVAKYGVLFPSNLGVGNEIFNIIAFCFLAFMLIVWLIVLSLAKDVYEEISEAFLFFSPKIVEIELLVSLNKKLVNISGYLEKIRKKSITIRRKDGFLVSVKINSISSIAFKELPKEVN